MVVNTCCWYTAINILCPGVCVHVCVVHAASSQIAISPLCPYRKAWVFSGWECDVQLKGRIETDYLVNSWHPLAAWNRPEHQGLICKWITPLPGPPLSLPSIPSSSSRSWALFLFSPFFLCVCVHLVPRSSFYIVPWQMLCWAAIVPHQFFWGLRESQKDFHMWF